MSTIITARPLTRDAFAPFGDVIDMDWQNHFPINAGMCERFHDLSPLEAIGEDARTIVSIARSMPCEMPLSLKMVERHPLGSQLFMPLQPRIFLVVVCPDEAGRPGEPQAFLTAPGQGVNYRRDTWHGVLTPLGEAQDFLVVDRAGEGVNLEEFTFERSWLIRLP